MARSPEWSVHRLGSGEFFGGAMDFSLECHGVSELEARLLRMWLVDLSVTGLSEKI